MLAYLDEPTQEAALQKQAYYQHTQFTHADTQSLKTELLQIQAEGFSYDREEHETGIICIAKPILLNGRPIGALSITTTTARHNFEDFNEWKQPLTQAVEQIAQAAKDWQFPTL
jgi:DNA-binding IclR family transcriptional regulator